MRRPRGSAQAFQTRAELVRRLDYVMDEARILRYIESLGPRKLRAVMREFGF